MTLTDMKLTREPKPMHAGGSVAYRVTVAGRWVGWVGDARPWRGWRYGRAYWWACWREEGDTAARWNSGEAELSSRAAAIEALLDQVDKAKERIDAMEFELTKENVMKWLLDYAWLGTAEEQAATVECIMSQGDIVTLLDGRIEQVSGQAWDDEQAKEAFGFALSGLYECHDEPHLETCPDFKPLDRHGRKVRRDRDGLRYVTTPDSGTFYITECCDASAKGSDDGIVCRSCSDEVDSRLGGTPEPLES